MSTALQLMLKIIRVLLGALFVVSGVSKLFVLPEVTETIREVIDLPHYFRFTLAVCLCAIEIALGGMLIFRRHVEIAAISVLLMTLALTLVQISVILQPAEVECHCFGGLIRETIGWQTLARNTVIMILAWVVTLRQGNIGKI